MMNNKNMTVTLPNGIDVRYTFRYLKLNDPRREITQCIIYDPVTKKNLAFGETRLNPEDRPNRNIARKIAFGRAVCDLRFVFADATPHEDARALWQHFLAHVRYE